MAVKQVDERMIQATTRTKIRINEVLLQHRKMSEADTNKAQSNIKALNRSTK